LFQKLLKLLAWRYDAAEGSEQLGSLIRCDRFPVSYSDILRLGAATFGELPDLWREMSQILLRLRQQRVQFPKIDKR